MSASLQQPRVGLISSVAQKQEHVAQEHVVLICLWDGIASFPANEYEDYLRGVRLVLYFGSGVAALLLLLALLLG